jgi:hypothetical protein
MILNVLYVIYASDTGLQEGFSDPENPPKNGSGRKNLNLSME